MIDTRQKLEGWDSGVIPHRTAELKRGQERNIDLMTAFYQDCPDSTAISPQAAAKLGAVAAFSFQPEWKGMMIEYYYQSTSCFLGKIFCKSAFMCRPYRAQGLITSYPGRREP